MPLANDTTSQINDPSAQENGASATSSKPVKPLKTILLVVVGAIFVLSVALVSFWYGNKLKTPAPLEGESITSPEKEKEELPIVDETEGWKTYTDPSSIFSFKYPSDAALRSASDRVSVWKNGPTQREGTELYDGILISFSEPILLNGKTLAEKSLELCSGSEGISEVLIAPKPLDLGTYDTYTCTVSGLGIHRYIFVKSTYEDFFIWVSDSTNDPGDLGFSKIADQILSTFKFTDSADEMEEWKSYSSIEYGFSIRYPDYLTVKEERAGSRLASIRFEGAGEYLGFSIEKDFVGGWVGKEDTHFDIDVDGEVGEVSSWLSCDSQIRTDWEVCNKNISLLSYDSARVLATFSHKGTEWHLFYNDWNKGERDINSEMLKVRTILSTFKFID